MCIKGGEDACPICATTSAYGRRHLYREDEDLEWTHEEVVAYLSVHIFSLLVYYRKHESCLT